MAILLRYALINKMMLKEYLDLSGTGEDDFLDGVINAVTAIFEDYCNRKFTEQRYIEYYDGDGHDVLFVNNLPIVKIESLYDDTERDFASTDLIDSDDILVYNEDGMIRLYDDEAYFVKAVQNIKIDYWAGYKTLEVFSEENDKLDWKEGSGSELTATLTAGRYNVQELADHIKTQMEAVTGVTKTYIVKFDRGDNHFTIEASDASQLTFLWSTGTNASTNCGWLLGFDTSADDENVTIAESDYPIFPLPQDLIQACKEQCAWIRKQSYKKDGLIGITSKSVAGQSISQSFVRDALLPSVQSVLDKYRITPYDEHYIRS